MHTHAALLAHQRNLNDIRGLTADDRLFCNSPFFWIGGFAFGLLATLVAGLDTGVLQRRRRRRDPRPDRGREAHHDQWFRRRRSPTCRATPASPAGTCRRCGAATSTRSWPPDARPADPELRHNMLGMTEAGSVLLLSGDETDQPEHRRGSFGRPAPGFETRVIDPDTGDAVASASRRAVHPRAVCDAALLRPQPRGVLRRRRLVSHRRSRPHRRRRLLVLRRPARGDDQDRGRQRRPPRRSRRAIARVDRRRRRARRRPRPTPSAGRSSLPRWSPSPTGRTSTRRARDTAAVRTVRLQDSAAVRCCAALPKFRCCPAARSTCPRCGSCSMPDTIDTTCW